MHTQLTTTSKATQIMPTTRALMLTQRTPKITPTPTTKHMITTQRITRTATVTRKEIKASRRLLISI